MNRLNNIIAAAESVVSYSSLVGGECWVCLALAMALGRSDFPLDWQRSQFRLYCQACTEWRGAVAPRLARGAPPATRARPSVHSLE